jgi:hypothetical protein
MAGDWEDWPRGHIGLNTGSWWETVGTYNAAVFPLQAVVALAAVALTCLVFARPGGRSDKLMKAYLSLLCAWNGLVFFLVYGRLLPGTILGAPLFILAAILFAWDLKVGETRFRLPEAPLQRFATGLLILLALLYPFLGAAFGHYYPESCTFGIMPCPTAVFALALLSAALPQADKKVYLLLLVWALPALGKCLGALDLYEDCVLFWAGVYALIMLLRAWRDERKAREMKRRDILDIDEKGMGKSWLIG